tara:strand:+ start:10487 stop:10705 length:219 start_codon:yes stop_codon:yes gene_type:complete
MEDYLEIDVKNEISNLKLKMEKERIEKELKNKDNKNLNCKMHLSKSDKSILNSNKRFKSINQYYNIGEDSLL